MKKMSKKKKKKKAFWEDHVGGLTNKKEPKKVTEVKEKKKPVRKVKGNGKDIVVQDKKDRSVEEAKSTFNKAVRTVASRFDKKRMEQHISDLMTNPNFGEWLQDYCYKKVERQATSRGQIPTELPEFNVLQRSQSSVELKRDAKGTIVFTIKAYADTSIESAKEAINTFLQVTKSVDNDEEE